MRSGIFERLYEKARVENGNVLCFSSAPGRADFLNTHQDYKMLPVVPVAIEKRTFIVCSKLDKQGVVKVKSLTLEKEGVENEDFFETKSVELVGGKWFGNYFRSIHMLFSKRYGELKTGLAIYVDSELPVASGLASSAALQVSLAAAYARILGLRLSKIELAEHAYEAEHDIMRIPCGRLDQYASSYGGIIRIDFKPLVKVEKFDGKGLIFVIADSGIKHSTAEIHTARQSELNTAIRMLRELKIPDFLRRNLDGDYSSVEWSLLKERNLEDYLSSLPKNLANRIIFTLRMQDSTEVAVKILKYRRVSKSSLEKLSLKHTEDWLEALGEIVNIQHILLRDFYDVSHLRLEEMRNTALEAGALGVKISGAGMGGSLIALVKTIEDAYRVEKAFTDAGARNVFTTSVERGVSASIPAGGN